MYFVRVSVLHILYVMEFTQPALIIVFPLTSAESCMDFKLIIRTRHFGPSNSPLLQVGYRGIVEVDAGFQAQMVTLDDYKNTCDMETWESTMNYARALKKRDTKIAFFSATPQGKKTLCP